MTGRATLARSSILPSASRTRCITTVPVPTVESVEHGRNAALTAPRINATLLAAFAIIALIVAAVGVHALVTYQGGEPDA